MPSPRASAGSPASAAIAMTTGLETPQDAAGGATADERSNSHSTNGPPNDIREAMPASVAADAAASPTARGGRNGRKKRGRVDEKPTAASSKKSPVSTEKRNSVEAASTDVTSPPSGTPAVPVQPPPVYCDVDDDDGAASPLKKRPVEGVDAQRPFSVSSGATTMTIGPAGVTTAPSVSSCATEIVTFGPLHTERSQRGGTGETDNEERSNGPNPSAPRRLSKSQDATTAMAEEGDSPPPRPVSNCPVGGGPQGTSVNVAIGAPPATDVISQSIPVPVLGNVTASSGGAAPKRRQMTLNDFQPPPPIETSLRKEIEEKTAKLEMLSQRVLHLEADVAHRISLHDAALQREERLQEEVSQYRSSLFSVMQELAQTTRRDARREQHSRHFELGHVITSASSGQGPFGSSGVRELWVEGNRTRELLRQQHALSKRETFIQQERKDLDKKLAALRKQGATPSAIADSFLKGDTVIDSTSVSDLPSPSSAKQCTSTVHIADAIETEERLQTLRRECDAIEAEKLVVQERITALDAEKKVFLKEIRRIAEEDASEFATRPAIGPACSVLSSFHGSATSGSYLSPRSPSSATQQGASSLGLSIDGTSDSSRYVLINLLGKGGFSEVWKAYDLRSAQFVACKIHKVGREMSAQQKQSYLRHAERELEIMRSLNHPKVTKLLDVFEPENTTDTFVAVMEYCAGTDLDTHLKIHRCIKELDAKTIMVQLIAALRHMADQPRPVIHYDLKPANILFEQQSTLCLDIKVTDFGLSKIIHNAEEEALRSNQAAGIELTSQGTGTYWYLPPECFDTSRTPTITGKVDVWAAGVIFYQMLYGRRPFADGVSQRQIWQEKLISQQASRKWDFPSTSSKISEEAKAVIQRCLAANPNDRCDIFQLSADPYFRKIGKGSAASLSSVGGGSARLATRNATPQSAAASSATDVMPPPPARLIDGGK